MASSKDTQRSTPQGLSGTMHIFSAFYDLADEGALAIGQMVAAPSVASATMTIPDYGNRSYGVYACDYHR